MRWPRTGAVLVLLGSTVGVAGCAQEQSSDPASTAPPVVSSVPIGDEATPAPTGSQGLVVQVPDHVRYGPDGVVVVRAGVETTLADQPAEWASSDGTGGVVYSIDGQVWWRPTESDDAVPIDADGLFARSVGGRPTLIARTAERCSGDGEFFWLVVHDLSSGEQQRLACVGWGGDATVGMSDVGDGRYIVRWEMDLANYSTAQGLAVGGFGGGDAGDPAGPLWNGLDLAGNPYPDAETCHVLRAGEPTAACDVHGRLSPDALLLATWYRPDFSIVVDPTGIPPEVVADEAGWLARLDTLPAEVTVHELDTGTERYRTELPARTRLADFDGRFLVAAPHCPDTVPDTCDDSAGTWTIIDTNGQQPPLMLAGPLVLLRPQAVNAPRVEVDAPRLGRGDTGPWVSFLQQRLQTFAADIAADGIFGPATEAAVRDFQTARSLAVDGLVGPKTWAALATGGQGAEPQPETPATTTTTAASTPTEPTTDQPETLSVLRPDGLGTVDFGTPADDAVEALSAMLGPPDDVATIPPIGSGEDGCVEGATWLSCLRELRVSEQGQLLTWTRLGLEIAIVDTDRNGGPAQLQFGDWHATPAIAAVSPKTAEGLYAGMNIGELRSVHPDVGFGYNEGLLDGYYVDASGGGRFWGRLDPNPATGGYDFDGLIRAVQAALNERGADLAVDGEWGPRTEAAWEEFLTSNNLPVFTLQLWMTPDIGELLGLPPDGWGVATVEPRPA